MEKVQNSSLMMEEMPPFYVFMVWTNKENMKKQGFSQNQSEVLNLKINIIYSRQSMIALRKIKTSSANLLKI
jgi:hypothetical protein